MASLPRGELARAILPVIALFQSLTAPRRLDPVIARSSGLLAREANFDLLGPALFVVAQLPDRTNGDLVDVPRQIVAGDTDALPSPHGQPARPLARDVVVIADGEPPLAGDGGPK